MAPPPAGPIETNVFIHAQTTDHLSAECRRFLDAVANERIAATLAPLVLHELSYVLTRVRPELMRAPVAGYMVSVVAWPGIQADKPLLTDAIQRCGARSDLGFVDAYLAALATRQSCPVYTKNVRDLVGQGVSVPDPLPDGSTP